MTQSEHRFRVYISGVVTHAPQRQPGDYSAADYLIVFATDAEAALRAAYANTEYQLMCSNARFNRLIRFIVLVLVGFVAATLLMACGGGDPEDQHEQEQRVPSPANPCYPDREVCK